MSIPSGWRPSALSQMGLPQLPAHVGAAWGRTLNATEPYLESMILDMAKIVYGECRIEWRSSGESSECAVVSVSGDAAVRSALVAKGDDARGRILRGLVIQLARALPVERWVEIA